MTPKILQKLYYYGGELKSLGAIILDLQKIAPNRKCIDAYVMGLTLKAPISNTNFNQENVL